MGKSVNDIIARLPVERQQRIQKQADGLIEQFYKLVEFRKAAGLTQAELAGRLSITQENVSRLERRDDMHLSTLRRYVEALGGKLEITVSLPDLPSNQGPKAGQLDY